MTLSYCVARFLASLTPNAVKNSFIDRKARIGHGTQFVNSSIAKYSYIGNNSNIVNTEIGSFCSIASQAIIGGGAHSSEFVSTSPVFCEGRNILHSHFAKIRYNPFKKTVIGHDVWIGSRVLVKGGVIIGNGAIIGMGSVVTKDVPPYAIVAGNPAKILRYRFNEDTIQELEKCQWWSFPEKQLRKYGELFDNPEKLLSAIADNTIASSLEK